MLERLQAATFEPLVGDAVRVCPGDGEPLSMEIARVQGLGGESGDRRQPFSLLFRGPAEPVLPQAIYRIEHPRLGELDLFLVPIGPEPDGDARILYEAIFN